MKKENYRAHVHCVYKLTYHLVLVTNNGEKCLTENMIEELRNDFRRLLELWDCEFVEGNGEADHFHLLFECHPSLQLSKLINNLKTVTSRKLRKMHREHFSHYFKKPVLWSRSYCVLSTGAAPIEVTRRYIENQSETAS